MPDPNSIKSPKIKKKVQAAIKAINKAQAACANAGYLSERHSEVLDLTADASRSTALCQLDGRWELLYYSVFSPTTLMVRLAGEPRCHHSSPTLFGLFTLSSVTLVSFSLIVFNIRLNVKCL